MSDRVNRQDDPIALAVPEAWCPFCGEPLREGRCGQRCYASRRQDEGRVERLDIEEA